VLILPFEPFHFLQNFDQFTTKHALQNDCYQWLSDSFKLQQVRFQPDPAWEAYSAPPSPLAGLTGPTFKRGERKRDEGRGGMERRKRREREG